MMRTWTFWLVKHSLAHPPLLVKGHMRGLGQAINMMYLVEKWCARWYRMKMPTEKSGTGRLEGKLKDLN